MPPKRGSKRAASALLVDDGARHEAKAPAGVRCCGMCRNRVGRCVFPHDLVDLCSNCTVFWQEHCGFLSIEMFTKLCDENVPFRDDANRGMSVARGEADKDFATGSVSTDFECDVKMQRSSRSPS
jgi:hypothetical protein